MAGLCGEFNTNTIDCFVFSSLSVKISTKIIVKKYNMCTIYPCNQPTVYGINYVCTCIFYQTKRVPCAAHFEPMHTFPIIDPTRNQMGSPWITHVGPNWVTQMGPE